MGILLKNYGLSIYYSEIVALGKLIILSNKDGSFNLSI